MGYVVLKTAEFEKWINGKKGRSVRRQVEARIERIAQTGHFGTVRVIEDITELKWTDGTRVYLGVIEPNVYCLLGGNKNGQSKDIESAKKIFAEIQAEVDSASDA